MALTDYTTYAEVRAVLGVSATEINDTVLAQSQWAFGLILDLEDTSVNIPSLYATVSALPALSRTTAQQRFYDLVRLFASYSTAQQLLASLPLFSVQKLTDGRAEFNRFAEAFKEVADDIRASFTVIRVRLATSYQGLAPGDAVIQTLAPVFVGVSTLAVDPVTATS